MISRPDKGLHTIPCIVLLNPKVSTYIKYSFNDLWVVITFSKAQRILESLIKGMGDNEDFAFLKTSCSLCSYILVTTLKKNFLSGTFHLTCVVRLVLCLIMSDFYYTWTEVFCNCYVPFLKAVTINKRISDQMREYKKLFCLMSWS